MKVRLWCLGLTVLGLLSFSLSVLADTSVNAVVRISGVNSQKEPVMGTGFLIQADASKPRRAWLVSAAHLFAQISGDKIELLLRRGDKAFSQPYQLRSNGRNLFFRDDSYDLAAFLLELPVDCSCSLLAPAMLADDEDFRRYQVDVGSRLLIYGFPYGESFDQTGNCIVRTGIISSSPLLPADRYPSFLADFEVFPGYSGAPVFSGQAGRKIIYGMVLEEVFLEELRPSGKKTKRTRHGLGLARVLLSSHIRDFIAELGRR